MSASRLKKRFSIYGFISRQPRLALHVAGWGSRLVEASSKHAERRRRLNTTPSRQNHGGTATMSGFGASPLSSVSLYPHDTGILDCGIMRRLFLRKRSASCSCNGRSPVDNRAGSRAEILHFSIDSRYFCKLNAVSNVRTEQRSFQSCDIFKLTCLIIVYEIYSILKRRVIFGGEEA